MEWKGKHIVIGVTGSIAAYKTASLVSALKKKQADVTVIMTKNATQFVAPLVFETLSQNRCLTDTFDRNFRYDVEHVELAKKADVFLVAPASANVIAKAAHGIADDMLTTTLLACECPKLFAPAMNTRMYQNPVTQENLKTLERFGMEVISPASGYLACGDVGEGKMPEPEDLLLSLEYALSEKDLSGEHILVSAGPTQEALDPVRYLTNHSTGKMGYAVAKAAARRGARVTLVSGPVSLDTPPGVERIDVVSAQDMYEAVRDRAFSCDTVIMAAAVADYRPEQIADEKMKKTGESMTLPLTSTTDILGALGSDAKRGGLFLCGFSMETENLLENSEKKLEKKGLDMIVANNIRTEGAGFGTETNVVTFITGGGREELPILSKEDVADRILDQIKSMKEK